MIRISNLSLAYRCSTFFRLHPPLLRRKRQNKQIYQQLCFVERVRAIDWIPAFLCRKQDIEKYYRGYTVCEHPLNKGDLTPFVIAFSEIIVSAMESMRNSLRELRNMLEEGERMAEIVFAKDEKAIEIASVLVTAALFAFNGITMAELTYTFDASRQTMYKKLAPFKERGVLVAQKEGRKTYYRMDLDALRRLADQQ